MVMQQCVFEPDDLSCMAAAYDVAVGLMPQAALHNALGSLLATQVIELVQAGQYDLDEIGRLAAGRVRPRVAHLGL
jgi:hypothetical protein